MNDTSAVELRRLAQAPELGPCRSQLVALADALDAGGDALDPWAYTDLFAAFKISDAPRADRSDVLRRTLQGAPTILVFVPILITWFGLSAASRAYRIALERNPDLEARPFLELWQSGFSGSLPPALAFDRIALYTVATLLLLICFIVVGSWDRRRLEARACAREAHLSDALRAALTCASLPLSSHRIASPGRFVGELISAAEELKELHTNARKVQTAAQRALTVVHHGMQQAERTVQELTETTTTMREAGMDTARHLSALTHEVGRLGRHAGDLSQAATGIAAATSSVETAVLGVATGSQRALDGAAENLASQLAGPMSAAVGDFSDATTRLAGASQVQVSALEAAIDVAGRVLEGVRAAEAHAEHTTRSLAAREQQLEAHQTRLGDAISQLHAAINALQAVAETAARHSSAGDYLAPGAAR